MQLIRSFSFALCGVALAIFCTMSVTGCHGRQTADEAWVDSVLEACDSIPEDTLVYDVVDAPLSEAVDGSFVDFLYTFTHNRTFQLSRLRLPLAVVDNASETLRYIRTQRAFDGEFNPTNKDCYVLLLNDMDEMNEAFGDGATEATLHLVDLPESRVRCFDCVRSEGIWQVTAESDIPFSQHSRGGFLEFYHRFVTDSVFQIAHVAQPLSISMPDEDEEDEMIEGTIDADQFPVFAPELPLGQFIIMECGIRGHNPHRVVMVKCGMASSMMDVLTFEKESNGWKLVSMEE